MKSAAVQRKKLKQARSGIAVIAAQVRSQSKLDTMLMRYPDAKRKVIFKAMRPYLKFDALYPDIENTRTVTKESFAELREKYGSEGP